MLSLPCRGVLDDDGISVLEWSTRALDCTSNVNTKRRERSGLMKQIKGRPENNRQLPDLPV